MQLRDYQENCLRAIDHKHKEGIHRQMVVLPTGSGKTVIFSELIKRKNLKTLVIAHRVELLEQARQKLKNVAPDIEIGILCGQEKDFQKQVTIASIQSAVNAMELLKKEDYQLLIIDEAHHAAAKSYKKLMEYLGFKSTKSDSKNIAIDQRVKKFQDRLGVPYRASNEVVNTVAKDLIQKHSDKGNHMLVHLAKEAQNILNLDENQYECFEEDSSKLMIGFTATPKRGDRVRLEHIFQAMVFTMSIQKLVNRGYLVAPKGVHVKVGIDLRGVAIEKGDFRQVSLRKIMMSNSARKIVTNSIKKFASTRRGIVFGVGIEHAEMLKKDIIEAGFTCEVVHSQVPMDVREQRLKNFADGTIQFITNPLILTEGYDCPRADCMINAAPTQNRSLYIQKAGRVLRIHPEKDDALLIDFGQTKKRHVLRTAVNLMGEFAEVPVQEIKDIRELLPLDEMEEEPQTEETINAVEKEYDPLSGKADTPWIESRRDANGRLFYDSIPLLDPILWPYEERTITKNQMELIQKLSKQTATPIPEEETLVNMGIGHASNVIEFLIDKRDQFQADKPITYKQKRFLESIIGNLEEKYRSPSAIASLNLYEAKSLIGKHMSRR
jgi:superfamily II DNA or RNA helicase